MPPEHGGASDARGIGARAHPARRRARRPVPTDRPAHRERGRAVLARLRLGAPARRRGAHHRLRRRAGSAAARGGPHARPPCSTAGCSGCWTSTRPTSAASWSTSGARAPASTSCSPTAARSPPRCAAWIIAEVADTLALAHEAQVAHGRLVPENVLIDTDGAVRLIGFAVDAALHGLPAGRISTDIADLVGLLYAAMTGKWAGRQPVGGAPRAVDPRPRAATPPGARRHPAHPRRPVRPRAQPRRRDRGHRRDARRLAARLPRPVGGGGRGLAGPHRARQARGGDHRPAAAARPASAGGRASDTRRAGPTGAKGSTNRTTPRSAARRRRPRTHWPRRPGCRSSTRTPTRWSGCGTTPRSRAPPPAFDPPPERPLFAPDPEDGQPVRRPRSAPVTQGAGGGGFWPWENTGTGVGTGSGVLPAYVEEDEEDNRHAPGTNMLRLAGIIAACLLVLVACVIAFNLGRGKTPLGTTKDDTTQGPSKSSSSSGTPSATRHHRRHGARLRPTERQRREPPGGLARRRRRRRRPRGRRCATSSSSARPGSRPGSGSSSTSGRATT